MIKNDKQNGRTPKDVLQSAIKLQELKGRDYQNVNSTIKHADYYPRGIDTMVDTMNGKLLRIRSVLDKYRNSGETTNFESIQDSLIDLINYASFAASWLEGGIDGQNLDNDIFNIPNNTVKSCQKSNIKNINLSDSNE